MSMQPYDIIGDIHGHADELRDLLNTLSYRKWRGLHRHPEGRKALFLGDFVDRGPQIRRVLETVRSMVEAGEALAILGNHEVNAIRYGTPGSDALPLRPHTHNNTIQHQKTLDQFPDPAEWASWLEWFSSLPLYLDLGGLRAVHACWDFEALNTLTGIGRLEGQVLERFSRKGTSEYDAVSQILNGPEAELPEGYEHETSDGRMRTEFRVKWWIDITGLNSREAIFPENPEIPELPPRDLPKTGYPEDAPPTFFGHYALKEQIPAPIRPNLACLDYGTGKGGFLCAYRWDGESEIDPGKFVTSQDTGGLKFSKIENVR